MSETGAASGLRTCAPRPNPASGAAAIPFSLPETGRVRLAVYDVLGREVAVLVDAEVAAGRHEAGLDAGRLAAGVYVVRLATADSVQARRLTVAR